MSEDQGLTLSSELNSRVLVGGLVLAGVGGVLAFTGFTVTAVAVLSATRRWLSHRDVPPSEVVRHKWEQARSATAAGANAWKSG